MKYFPFSLSEKRREKLTDAEEIRLMLAKKLREERIGQKFSQENLSEIVNVDVQKIARAEKNKHGVKFEDAVRYMQALDLPIASAIMEWLQNPKE